MHMDEGLYSLYDVMGDTDFRYADLKIDKFITQEVRVRVSSTSAFFTARYLPRYIERPPIGASTFLTLTLATQYTLDIDNPYMTIMLYTMGGPSTYTLEYGRIDERDF